MIRTHRKLWISMALLLIAVLAGIFGLSAVSPALAQQTGIVEKTSDANDGKYKEYTAKSICTDIFRSLRKFTFLDKRTFRQMALVFPL